MPLVVFSTHIFFAHAAAQSCPASFPLFIYYLNLLLLFMFLAVCLFMCGAERPGSAHGPLVNLCSKECFKSTL